MRSQFTVAVLCILFSTMAWAEQRPRIFGGSDSRFTKFTSGDIVFSHPDDWRHIAVPPPTVAAFTKGDDLSFTITRTPVDFPQSYNEAFVEYESQALRKQYPDATDFLTTAVKHRTLGEILQVDFTRASAQSGRNSRPLRHRFLAVPAGNYVYRVICVARADEFAKRHEPVFDRVIDSLVITPPQPKAAGTQ
jgi:hypothetical protein